MASQFSIIASKRSLHALSVVLKTEGLTFQRGAAGESPGINLISAEEAGEGFEPPTDSRLFITLSPVEDRENGRRLAEKVLGVSYRGIVSARKGSLRFGESPIFERTHSLLRSFGFSEVLVPIDGVVECEIGSDAEILADIEVGGRLYPAIILRDGNFLVTFDLGRSLASLLTETYFERESREKPLSPIASLVYRVVPYDLRLAIYRGLAKRARSDQSRAAHFTTKAPIDPAGWTLYQVLANALDHSLNFCPRIWKWPQTYSYAFCFTHDIEPRKYAYYQGLPRLFDILGELNISSTISVVAEPRFVLPEDALKELPRAGHEIISHGLHHDGTFSAISSGERARQIAGSRQKLERVAGTAVKGFRAPWLQRTADLGKLLEDEGISFDSSFVDVDTSLKKVWHGKGISFNFPFRLFTCSNEIKEYRVLELPLAGPQDMEPYFAGLSLEQCKTLFKQKCQWLKSIGGLYVFLAHAGVFGHRDLEIRMSLLRYLHNLVKDDDVWLARLGQVWEWWLQRESLRVTPGTANSGELSLEVENKGDQEVCNFSVTIPSTLQIKSARIGKKLEMMTEKNGYFFVPVAKLKSGEKIEIRLSGEAK